MPTCVTVIPLEKALSRLPSFSEVTQLGFLDANSFFPAASSSEGTRGTPHQNPLLDRMDQAAVAVGGQNGTNINPGWTRIYTYPSPAAGGAASSKEAGIPGIYLHVAGPVGRLAEGSPVYYGSDRVAFTSTYLLTITNQATNTTSRVLAEGVVDARGNLEARALLPSLQPGDYDVVFQGKHRGGAGLRLSARITVGDAGQITVLGPNIPQVW